MTNFEYCLGDIINTEPLCSVIATNRNAGCNKDFCGFCREDNVKWLLDEHKIDKETCEFCADSRPIKALTDLVFCTKKNLAVPIFSWKNCDLK